MLINITLTHFTATPTPLTKMFGMPENNYRNFNKLYLIFCLLIDLDSSRESETSIKCSSTRESTSKSYSCKSEFIYCFNLKKNVLKKHEFNLLFLKKVVQIKFVLVQLKCKAKFMKIMISKHKMIQILIRAKKPKK